MSDSHYVPDVNAHITLDRERTEDFELPDLGIKRRVWKERIGNLLFAPLQKDVLL